MASTAITVGNGEYLHRRQFFRMDCCVPLSFSLMKEDNPGDLFLGEKYYGIIRDLSGGGMRMATEFEIAERDSIAFIFHLDKEFFRLIGGIRSQTHYPGSYLPHLHGIMFMGLSMHRRETIISYLHRCQLMSLRLQNKPSRNYQPVERMPLHKGVVMGRIKPSA